MNFKSSALPNEGIFKSRLLTLLFVALTSLFVVGCGDSNNDFVATGTTPSTGTLVFQFDQAPAAQAVTVPNGTTTLKFDFFNSSNVSVLTVADVAYADLVTIDNVPVTATRVTITAYGPGGVPLVTIDSPVAVIGGSTNNVNLSGATVTNVTLNSISVSPNPITVDLSGTGTQQLSITGTFSNGDVVTFNSTTGGTASFTGNNTGVATVDNGTRVVTGVSNGSTTVDVSFTINGSTANLAAVPITVGGVNGQLIVQPDTLTFEPGGLIGAISELIGPDQIKSVGFFRAYFLAPGATVPVEVTPEVGVSFTNIVPSTVGPESFTHINLLGDGIAITSNPLAPTPPFRTTATMVVTYIDDSGNIFTDNVAINLDTPELVAVDFPLAPNGDTVSLPSAATNFPVFARAHYENGYSENVNFGGAPNQFGDTFTLTSTNTGTATVDTSSSPDSFTGVSAGTTTLQATANGGSTPVGSLNLNLIAATVNEVALTPSSITVDPVNSYSVIFTYTDSSTQDVTGVWGQIDTFNSTGGDVAFGGITSLFGNIEAGRLLGAVRGMTELRIDQNGNQTNVTNYLTGTLGLTGSSDTDPNNNVSDLDVLSTVPLAFITP